MIAAALGLAAALGWLPADAAALQAPIDAILSDPLVRSAHVGVLAIDVESGLPLYERNADGFFQPGSTLKLLTGSALLETLGPDARLHTTVTWSPPILTIHAGGDPTLKSDDLAAAARAVAAAGVRDVWRIDIDESRYDGERFGPGWPWDDLPQGYAPPVSPAVLDGNAVRVHAAPGAKVGDRPQVTVAPVGTPVTVRIAAHTAAAGTTDSLDVVRDGATVVVVGTIPLEGPADDLEAAVPDAAASMRAEFALALRAAGVTVRGPALIVTFGGAEAGREPVLWAHDSPPLATLVADCWLPSDNLAAEIFLRELGVAAGVKPGSASAGLAAAKAWFASAGGDSGAVDAVDGSGLSPYDRITPRALVALLAHDWKGPQRDRYLAALPVSGRSGTLAASYGDPELLGRVHAKTGSLAHVAALAGYLEPACHGPVAFALLVDEFVGDRAALGELRGRVLRRIVGAPCPET